MTMIGSIVCVLGVFAASAGAVDDAAVRVGVEGALARIETAVLAGDAAAYLAEVDLTEPEFAHEQRYFANDLTTRRPVAFDLTLGEEIDVASGVESGVASGMLTMAWGMEGKAARELAYRARFVERDGRWLYGGEAWERFEETPGVVVTHEKGLRGIAKATSAAFAEVRGPIERLFGLEASALPGRTQVIRLYGSVKHLQASITLSYEAGLSGWNEPGESIKLLAPREVRAKRLRSLVAHEYGHVASFEMGPRANFAPWWVLEGLAELAAAPYREGKREEQVAAWAREGKLVAWDLLATFDIVQRDYGAHVYGQGRSMVAYVTERWGDEGRNAWVRAMSAGRTLDEATREALGLSFAQVDAAWRGTLPAEEK